MTNINPDMPPQIPMPLFPGDIRDAIASIVPAGIADLDTGEILFASWTLEELFGYIEGELAGKNVDDLVPLPQRLSHTNHRAAYASRPKRRAMGAGMNLQGLHHDGHSFPVEVGIYPKVIKQRRCVIFVVLTMSERLAHNRPPAVE